MVKDCFYYSTITPNGHHSLISKQNFCGCEKILLHGESDAVKQKLFDCVKSEYCCTDLLRDDCKAGVYCKNKNFVVADSNYSAFNSYRKFNLSDYQNKEILSKYNKEINCILSERQTGFERCQRFLKACKSISDDALRIDSQSVDRIKINRFTENLWKKSGGTLKGKIGSETKMLVSCITQSGVEFNREIFDKMCNKVIVICDKTGAASQLIVERIRRYALSSGYDIISCICPMNPNVTEHIIIPELHLGIFSSEYYHRAEFKNSRKIFASRFHTPEKEKTKQRVDFTLKAYHSLMNEVFSSIEQINICNKKADKIFLAATDIQKAADDLINKLL